MLDFDGRNRGGIFGFWDISSELRVDSFKSDLFQWKSSQNGILLDFRGGGYNFSQKGTF